MLGRAVAVGHVLGAAAGLRETDRLREVLGERHRWHAVRGHLHELGGDLPAAATAYAEAARRATNVAERDHLVRQAARARAAELVGTVVSLSVLRPDGGTRGASPAKLAWHKPSSVNGAEESPRSHGRAGRARGESVHGAHVQPGGATAAGSLRHAPARRPSRAEVRPAGRDRARGPGVHRADGHVLPRHRGRRGAAAVLVQGRRPWLCAGARRARARVPELRRQRDVPLDGQRAGQPARRDALHRLRLGAPVAAARQRRREHRRGGCAIGVLPRGAVHRPSPRDRGVPELPAVHPPHGAGGTVPIRAARRVRHAGSRLEANRVGAGRAPRGRSRATRRRRSAYDAPPGAAVHSGGV